MAGVAWYDLDAVALPEPRRPRVVATLAAGPAGRELHAVTGPLLRRYADRVGADLLVIEPPHAGAWPLAWKWVMGRVLRKWERAFYCDADALVRPTSPDVFALVPEACVGAVDEAFDFLSLSPDGGAWWRRDVGELQRQLGAVVCDHPFAFNAGVYVASRRHAAVFDQPPRGLKLDLRFCSEQHLVNEHLFKRAVPVCRLGGTMNARWMWQRGDVFRPENFVVHLSGMPHADRLAALGREAARWAAAAAVA